MVLPEGTKEFIRKNPYVYLFVKASGNTLSEAIIAADRVRSNYIAEYPWLEGRVKIIPGDEDIVYFDGNYLLYAPLEWKSYISEVIAIPNAVRFSIEAAEEYRDYVDAYRVSIVNNRGKEVRELIFGKGVPSRECLWDLQDNYGNFALPEQGYNLKLELDFGKVKESFLSEPVFIEDSQTKRSVHKEIIAGFDLASDYSLLESWLEDIVTSFMEIESGSLFISGFSDSAEFTIGDNSVSQKRAERINRLVRAFIKLRLGEEKSVDNWLHERNAIISYKGVGIGEPFSIYDVKNWKRILVGKEVEPYRNFIWRRVELKWF